MSQAPGSSSASQIQNTTNAQPVSSSQYKDGDINLIFNEMNKLKDELRGELASRKEFDALALQVDKNMKEIKAHEQYWQDLEEKVN